MAYTIGKKRIYSEIVELNVADQCNLSCRACSHLSPIAKKQFLEPEFVYQDLARMAPHYRASRIRLLGGEPLLHPNLLPLIDAVRSSDIAAEICVVTNGILRDRITDELLSKIDRLEISEYPGFELPESALKNLKERTLVGGSDLVFRRYEFFRESFSEIGLSNKELVQEVYDSCLIAQRWGCHNIQGGYFYKCPQAHVLKGSVLRNVDLPVGIDGVKIDNGPDLLERLISYLESPKPLHACTFCMGSVGKLIEHSQVSRKEWRSYQQFPSEQMLDYSYLRQLREENPDANNGCSDEEEFFARAPSLP